ncbi:tetratricopeptide repeat protein [Marinoscillum sp.]|uniref:tetratricopeptide repeat protein n=1 Tax=Marinoscillum sp. TaxID=2024838 RepID=UPI003BA9801F
MRVTIILLFVFSAFSAFSEDLSRDYENVMDIYRQGDYPITREAAQNFLEVAKAKEDIFYMAKTYYLLGYVCSQTDDFGNAIIYYLEGARHAEISEREDLEGSLIAIYKNLAVILGDYGHYELSHKFINEGLRVAGKRKDESQIIVLLNNRIHELLEEQKMDQALVQIDSLLNNFQVSEQRRIVMTNKIGVAYSSLGENRKALEYYGKVIAAGPEISPETYALSVQNAGTIHLDEKEYDKAISFYLKAYEFNIDKGFILKELRTLEKMGQTYSELGDYDQALHYYQKAIDLIEDGHQTPTSYEIFREVSKVYSTLGAYETALEYGRQYSEHLEQFIAQQKEIEELDKKYNIQLLTDRYFDLLAANTEKQETERMAKFGIAGSSLFFLALLLIVLYRNHRVKREIENQLKSIELLSEV